MLDVSPNTLVPKLLKQMNNYAKNLKERVKINEMLNEFNGKANKNFAKFVQLSKQRYKSVKSGSHINNIINYQMPQIEELSKEIITDKLFNNKDMHYEAEKKKKNMDTKLGIDIYKLRNTLISKTKDYSKAEMMKRENMIEKIIKKRKKLNLQETGNNNMSSFKSKGSNFFKEMNNSMTKKRGGPQFMENYTDYIQHNIDEIDKKKKFYQDIMNKDLKKINDKFLKYHNFLDKTGKIFETKPNIKKADLNFGKLYKFELEDMIFLNYREREDFNKRAFHKDESKIDIMKFIKYTERANPSEFKKKLKLKFSRRLHQKLSENKIRIPKNQNNKSINEKVPSINLTNISNFNEYKNTIKTVRSEANKIRYINDYFSKKTKTMNNFFKTENLPKINDYEKLINGSIDYKSQKRKRDNSRKNIGNSFTRYDSEIKYDRSKTDYQIKKDIINSYNNIYLSKKKIWKKDDIEKAQIKAKAKEEIEEVYRCINEINNQKRKPNLYIDPYSKRDDKTNNLIKFFISELKENFCSKKKFEKIVDIFNNNVENMEKDAKLNEQILSKILEEQARRKMEESIEYKIFSKMKERLRTEKNEDENLGENIDFNYKFILDKNLIDNKFKIDPYQDYKEKYHMAKEKMIHDEEEEKKAIINEYKSK